MLTYTPNFPFHQPSSRANQERTSSKASRSDNAKEWTQEELDSFIAKNDWQSVSKYINDMRVSKNQPDSVVERNQPSIREIQERIDYNRSLEQNGSVPKSRFGARSQMQHDEISASQQSADSPAVESESVWQSLSSASYESSEHSSYYHQRQSQQRSSRRRGSSPREMMM